MYNGWRRQKHFAESLKQHHKEDDDIFTIMSLVKETINIILELGVFQSNYQPRYSSNNRRITNIIYIYIMCNKKHLVYIKIDNICIIYTYKRQKNSLRVLSDFFQFFTKSLSPDALHA